MNLFKVTILTSVYNGYAELNAARSRSLIKSGIAPLPVLKYIDLKSNDKSSSWHKRVYVKCKSKKKRNKRLMGHMAHIKKKISILFRNEDACIEIYIYKKKSSIIIVVLKNNIFFLLVSLYHELWPPFWALELTWESPYEQFIIYTIWGCLHGSLIGCSIEFP